MAKRESFYTAGGNVNWPSHCVKVWRFLKKIKMELPHDPAILLLGIYLPKQNYNLKIHMHLNIHMSTIYNGQYMETA